MTSSAPKTRTWRVDRDKRSRIIRATIDVIKDRGLEGVNHRNVAAAAAVSLSAITYYFSTLDDLLEAALAEAISLDLKWMAQRLDPSAGGDDDVIALMAALLAEGIKDGYFNIAVELSVVAMRNLRFRALAFQWEDDILAMLGQWMDPTDARVLSALTYGLAQIGIVSPVPPDVADLEAVLRRGLR